jgi:putative membrane protein
MKTAAQLLCAFVALQHFAFLVIEMFLWKRPFGRKLFQMSEQLANDSAPLAMNQGLYNGFLAAGLVWGLVRDDAAILTFFLACVIVAGIFGGLTAKISIMFVQGLPGAIALALVRLLPVFVLVALAGAAVADGKAEKAGTLQNTTYGFTVDAPGFPKLGDEDEATLVQFPAPTALGPTSVTVSLAVRPAFKLDRVREGVRRHLDKQGFHLRDEKNLKVSGRDATIFTGDGPYKGQDTKVLELVVWDPPRMYTVVGMCKTDDWARDEAALRQSVESLKLDEKK